MDNMATLVAGSLGGLFLFMVVLFMSAKMVFIAYFITKRDYEKKGDDYDANTPIRLSRAVPGTVGSSRTASRH